ncbi:BRO-N domain-containing protein [Mycobacteroides abscessus]|uniref:BRO-N domain-containing protein n=1 Tax=Mycobacteroides abscessus TaxID=36809 RepID=UPI000C25DE43|nr:Bro-N domain-containing protein [Mycobacteroides abscessus]MBN7567257.1 Bro-N domain-containing protein [Mycobacteroides abscessus subsp. massiliense]
MPESSGTPTSNTSSIELFNFHHHSVRVVVIGGEPWFVLADLCKVLGILSSSAVTDVKKRLDQGTLDSTKVMNSAGYMRETDIVSEAGMYEVVIRSDKPEAVEFRRFVTGTVLPSIRKHGGYLTEEKIEEVLLSPDTIIRLATDLKNERSLRIALEEQRELDRPALEYVDTHVVVDDDVMLIEDWGRTYGLTRPQAFALLRDEKDLIYAKRFERWSESQGCKVAETEYRPRAGKPSFTWFDVKEQRDAPRRNNGQARKTLYVRAVHSVDLARLVGLLPNIEVAS